MNNENEQIISTAECPICGATYSRTGEFTSVECTVCGQILICNTKRKRVKDSTELSGGHLW